MRALALLFLAVGVMLGACSADALPTESAPSFAGISTSNPRDLPLNFESREEGRPGPNGGTMFDPISAPIDDEVAYRFDLGHCGLLSPVDLDGSFWDPLDGVTFVRRGARPRQRSRDDQCRRRCDRRHR